MGIWDKNQLPGMQAIGDAFTAKYPNITVDVQVTPWSEYWTKLEAAATGGAMPDVFWMHTNHFMKYAGNDMLMDLTNIFEGTTESYANFPEGFVNFFKYDGVQLGIPKDFDTIYMLVSETNPAFESTQSLMYLFYRQSFIYDSKGYASAIVLWTFFITPCLHH